MSRLQKIFWIALLIKLVLAAIIPLTNAVITTNGITTNTTPQYYSFDVPTNAYMATFQIFPTNGEVDLYVRYGTPYPSQNGFDYASA